MSESVLTYFSLQTTRQYSTVTSQTKKNYQCHLLTVCHGTSGRSHSHGGAVLCRYRRNSAEVVQHRWWVSRLQSWLLGIQWGVRFGHWQRLTHFHWSQTDHCLASQSRPTSPNLHSQTSMPWLSSSHCRLYIQNLITMCSTASIDQSSWPNQKT